MCGVMHFSLAQQTGKSLFNITSSSARIHVMDQQLIL